MRINNVSNQQCYNQSFKSLILTDNAKKHMSNLSEERKEELEQISNRLEKSKYWDLKVDVIEVGSKPFTCTFINKQNPKNVHQYGLNPYKRIGNQVKVFSVIDDKSERLETLTFPNETSARAMINMRLDEVEQKRHGKYRNFYMDQIKRWEQRVNFLEEAYAYMDKKGLIKDDVEISRFEEPSESPSHIDFIVDDLKEKVGVQ